MPRQYRDNLRFERSADTAEWICGGAGSSRQDKRHGRAPCRRRCVHGGYRGACRSPRRPSKDEPGRGGKYIRAARGTPGLNMLRNDNPRPKKEFRLGFDTATEVSLLRIAATQGSRRLFPWAITVFPILFSAGMLAHRHHGRSSYAKPLWLGLPLNHFARSITTSLLRWRGFGRSRNSQQRSSRLNRYSVPLSGSAVESH